MLLGELEDAKAAMLRNTQSRGRHPSQHASSTAVSEETFNVEAQSHTTRTTQKTRNVLLVRS